MYPDDTLLIVKGKALRHFKCDGCYTDLNEGDPIYAVSVLVAGQSMNGGPINADMRVPIRAREHRDKLREQNAESLRGILQELSKVNVNLGRIVNAIHAHKGDE